ncbi:MAG: F0F1 ATP synthase subunit A [Acidimicrobiales bacterium]
MIFGIDFPPITHAVEWKNLFGGDTFGVNKVVLLMWLTVIIVFAFFFIASRKRDLVPTGLQNVAESSVDFVRNGIILETMGEDGLPWTPFLLSMFSFIFVCNIWEIIPIAQMPVNARIALPAFMAIIVWLLYMYVGIAKNGFFHFFGGAIFPPGVPKALYLLVTPIELVQLLIVRPLSQSVRLFANMLAGHLLLISFAVLSTALFEATYIGAALPGALLVALTGFEVLVAFLQAYIFTILTAVYIGSSMHPEH